MRVDIDKKLLDEAKRIVGMKDSRAVVAEALRLIVKCRKAKSGLQKLAGTGWDGDLEAMRKNF